MTAQITLYTNPMSRGRIVLWLLEELGEPYKIETVAFGPRMKSSKYTAINPMGKVPALTHGKAVITETAAILTYLADSFASKQLIPPSGSEARAAFYRWMFFVAGPLEAACSNAFLNWTPPDNTPMGTPSQGYLGFGNLQLTLNTLEQHLTLNPYVCGTQFTAADVYLASHLNFNTHFTKVVALTPVFQDYLTRCNQRPAKCRADSLNQPNAV
jgi:glutathione S-transferase